MYYTTTGSRSSGYKIVYQESVNQKEYVGEPGVSWLLKRYNHNCDMTFMESLLRPTHWINPFNSHVTGWVISSSFYRLESNLVTNMVLDGVNMNNSSEA